MNALLPQSLAEWRGREGVGLDQLARVLRVEPSTLERIEAGEVNPGNDLRERIGQTIARGFNHSDAQPRPGDTARGGTGGEPCEGATGSPLLCYGSSSDEFPSAAGNSPPQARKEGAAIDGEPIAAPLTFPAWGAWLAKRDGSAWAVELLAPSGAVESLPIEAARALQAKLVQLVAAHDAGPHGFAQAFP